MDETLAQFEKRKQDHIQYALLDETEARGLSGLSAIQLAHEALPDIDFDEITLSSMQLGQVVPTPFLVSSMTAGHKDALTINQRLMEAANERGWAMGVGSQRKELNDKEAHREWLNIRKQFPQLRLFGNIGISQLITAKLDDIKRLVHNLDANALQIHLNALQECIQPEGTPFFKGSLKAIDKACELDVPIIVKETGCGFSRSTLERLNQTGIKACDISGFGGTHWGRIEGLRSQDSIHQNAAKTFKHWGISTLDTMLEAAKLSLNYELWGSGGIRGGLDAAKLIALGAQTVGFAKPMLVAAMNGVDDILEQMKQIEFELRIALFCTGNKTINALKENPNAISRP